ncbi:unnamed protein product [Rotaria sp. Silwood2]|nr:unnamed protein product [Rotaria sp. Silwood2]
MLSLLMDIDALIASWRHKHVLLVQRQIGRKPDTGGTDDFFYLHQTVKEKYYIGCLVLLVSEKYPVFIDLFNVSSYLIPQRFLPKFFGQLTEPANLLSTLHVMPLQQVPVIRSNPREILMPLLQQFLD